MLVVVTGFYYTPDTNVSKEFLLRSSCSRCSGEEFPDIPDASFSEEVLLHY